MNFGTTFAQVSALEEAETAYNLLQFEDAVSNYDKAAAADPSLNNNWKITLKRGMANYFTGKYAAARELLETSAGQGNIYRDYTSYYRALSGFESGTEENALLILTELIKNYPSSPVRIEAQYKAGYILHTLERFDESNKLLLPYENSRALTAGRNSVKYYAGLNFISLGNPEKGEAKLMGIITSSPSEGFALDAVNVLRERRIRTNSMITGGELVYFAEVYINHRKYTEAEKLLKEYFRRFPNGKNFQGRAYFLTGRIKYQRGIYAAALPDFKNAFPKLKKPKLIREARLYIARCYAQVGNWRSANKEYERFAREYPSDRKAAEALWMAALNFERYNELIEAAKVYERIAKKRTLNPYRERAAFKVGFCWYKNDYITKSSRYFNNIRKQHPGKPAGIQAAFWEAKALEKLDKAGEAGIIYREIAAFDIRNYYVLTVRERLNIPTVFEVDTVITNEIVYSDDLRKKVEIGQIFGEPWAGRELRQYRRNSASGKQALLTLMQAYEDIGIYDEAIRLADRIYHKYYYKNNNAAIFQNLYPLHFRELMDEIPDARRVDNALLFGLIRRESLFGYKAISHAGATGLMQLMPATAKSLARSMNIKSFEFQDVNQPNVNMLLGIRNFRELMQRFRRNVPHALAAYNAGDAAVRRWIKRYGSDDPDEFIENIEYLETHIYVKEVIKNYHYYRQLYDDISVNN